MGNTKEQTEIDLTVDKKPLDSEMENRIKNFIEQSKKRNKKFLEKYQSKVEK